MLPTRSFTPLPWWGVKKEAAFYRLSNEYLEMEKIFLTWNMTRKNNFLSLNESLLFPIIKHLSQVIHSFVFSFFSISYKWRRRNVLKKKGEWTVNIFCNYIRCDMKERESTLLFKSRFSWWCERVEMKMEIEAGGNCEVECKNFFLPFFLLHHNNQLLCCVYNIFFS